jgi:hypothetical protein
LLHSQDHRYQFACSNLTVFSQTRGIKFARRANNDALVHLRHGGIGGKLKHIFGCEWNKDELCALAELREHRRNVERRIELSG